MAPGREGDRVSVAIGLALICLVPGGHGEVSESIYLLVQRKTENAVGRGAWPSAREPQGSGARSEGESMGCGSGPGRPGPPLPASPLRCPPLNPFPKPPDLSCFGFKMGITQSGPGDVHKGASCPYTASGTWGAAPLSPGVPGRLQNHPTYHPPRPPSPSSSPCRWG